MGQPSSKGDNTLLPTEIACPSPPPPSETPPVSSWAGITALEGAELQSFASETDRANIRGNRHIFNFTGAHAKLTAAYSVNEPEPLAWSMWSPYRLYLAVDREEARAVLTDGFRTALQARANTANPWGGTSVVLHQVPLDAVDQPNGEFVHIASKERDGILLVCDVQPGRAQTLHWDQNEGPLTALTEAGIDGVATWLYKYLDDEAKQRGTSFSRSIMGEGILYMGPPALFMPGADSCVSVRYLCEYTYSDFFSAGADFVAALFSSKNESDGLESN